MKKQDSFLKRGSWLIVLFAVVLATACDPEEKPVKQIPQGDKDRIQALGFSTDGLRDLGEFYLVENDILLRKNKLYEYEPLHSVEVREGTDGRVEQARVSDLISLANQRNITVFVDNTIPATGDDNWRTEVQQAIAQINAIPYSRIRMQYVTTGPADITIRNDAGALSDGTLVWTGSGWVRVNWVLAAAEWPAGGNAGFQVRINLDTDDNRVFTTGQKLRNIAHELGHCVGFRHTNWSGLGEAAGIGITGTPNTGSNPDPNSVMNGGTAEQTWIGFTAYDRIAYSSTYPAMTVNVSGPVKGWNSGTYTWNVSASNGIGPYTFEWRYGYDGTGYPWVFATGTTVTAPLPYDRDLHLQVTGTAADGETGVDSHLTMNLGDRP